MRFLQRYKNHFTHNNHRDQNLPQNKINNKMPIPTYTNQTTQTTTTPNSQTTPETPPNTRPVGSAGYASLDALSGMENNASGRLVGTGSGGTVTAPGYSAGENGDVLVNAESEDRALSREEAGRLYDERMEEEYAKREGGA